MRDLSNRSAGVFAGSRSMLGTTNCRRESVTRRADLDTERDEDANEKTLVCDLLVCRLGSISGIRRDVR